MQNHQISVHTNAPETLSRKVLYVAQLHYQEVQQTDDGFLVGSISKKVCSAFDTKETPHSYYLSLIKDPIDAQTRHEQWIAAIRDATWERTYFEESSVASLDALCYHFKRGLTIGVRLFLLK